MVSILAEFLNSLSGSPWMNINNSYSDKAGNSGTSQVSHGGTCYDAYSHGSSLSDADVLVSAPLYLLALPYSSIASLATFLNHPKCAPIRLR